MQIPEEIEFMSQTWTIRSANHKELVDCLGLCDPQSNTIVLDPGLPDCVMTQTLMHELVHLIEITLNQCLTEQQVDTIASGLIHLFRANPSLIKLLERPV
jgi:hypothetical protein